MTFVTPFKLPISLAKAISLEARCIPAWDRLVSGDMRQGSTAWHSHRRFTIGSSEAAAVFPGSISTTCTRTELFRKLRDPHNVAPQVFTDYVQEAIDMGNAQEPIMRRKCSLLFKRPIYEAGIFVTTHEDLPVSLSASPDGLMTDDEGKAVITEFKWRMGTADWDGDLGTTVFCQVQHQMRVIGCRSSYVYCTAGDDTKSLWLIQYSPSYFQMWLSWAKKLCDEVNESRVTGKDKPPRSEAGASAQTQGFLALEKRYHVVRLTLPPTR
jgi:predicted phage-related endonuclease